MLLCMYICIYIYIYMYNNTIYIYIYTHIMLLCLERYRHLIFVQKILVEKLAVLPCARLRGSPYGLSPY